MKRAKSPAKLIVLDNSDPISAETEAIWSRILSRASALRVAGELHQRWRERNGSREYPEAGK